MIRALICVQNTEKGHYNNINHHTNLALSNKRVPIYPRPTAVSSQHIVKHTVKYGWINEIDLCVHSWINKDM